MHILVSALLLGTFQATLDPDLGTQSPTPASSFAVLIPSNRGGPQEEMLGELVGQLRASGQFERDSIIEFEEIDLKDRRASLRQIRKLRADALTHEIIVCIGSQALIPFLAVKSELPDSVSLFSLGVLGVAHTPRSSKRQPLPNLYRLRGALCSDISMKMAICFTEQIRVGAGPYGAILSSALPDRYVQEAKSLAVKLGTSLEVERIDSSKQLEAAAARLIEKGIRTFIKLPDSTGVGDRRAAPVVSRIRLNMTRRGIAIMGLGPGDKHGAFGYVSDYAQTARDLAEMILQDSTGTGAAPGIRTPTHVVPYVHSPKHLNLRPDWAKTLTIIETH